jgi:hypothetical protein
MADKTHTHTMSMVYKTMGQYTMMVNRCNNMDT